MEEIFDIPVVLIIYNRPDTTQRVFDQIRLVKPSKLYVIADGPNINKPNDKLNCELTRNIINQVDWICEVKKNFSEENLGCGIRPSTGLSWVFSNEEYAIILEDDCVPSQAFFKYCKELLLKYKTDTRVMIISGNNYNEERIRNNDSYFFSRYGHSWGWATWKRVWQYFDYDMKKWPEFRDMGYMQDIFHSKLEANFFTSIFNRVYNNHQSVWDYQLAFAVWSNGGLSIVPSSNLVMNIGSLGTHSTSISKYHFRPINEMYTITKHPEFVIRNVWYDSYHFIKHWKERTKLSLSKRIITKLKSIIKFVILNLNKSK